MNPKTKRRENALKRLEEQLAKGTKPVKVNGKTTDEYIILSGKDVERIEKQIDILKERT